MGDEPQKFWAILIGIDHYHSPDIQNLSGCVRDVNNVESVLRGNILNENLEIIKITSDDPSGGPPDYANITTKVRDVTDRARQGDIVYFHFSGHGGRQARFCDALEPPLTRPLDNYFECLILHGNRPLKDCELGKLFDDLASRVGLFAVLDCCHSGGGDRASNQTVRQIDRILPADPPGEQLGEETQQVAETGHRAGSTRPSYWTRAREYTVLAACQPHQFAFEAYDADWNRVGALTFTLLRSLETLRQNGQPLTYRSLFYDVRARIALQQPGQRPKLFGIEDRELFSYDSHAIVRQATVCKADPGRVYIDQGEIHGVKKGDIWHIYRRGGLDLGTAIATITIDRVGAIRSSASLRLRDYAGVESGCPASIARPMYGEPLRVFVEDSALRELLANEPSIDVKTQEPDSGGATFAIRATSAGHYRVVGASGAPLSRSPVYISGETPVSEMQEYLRSLAHYWRVLNLHNTDTESNLQGQFDFAEEAGITTVTHGEGITLTLVNRREASADNDPPYNSTYSLYVTVLNLRADGTVTILFPQENEGQDSLPIAPGETRPVDLKMEILDTDGDVSEITDIFRMIVTDQPTSFYSLATTHATRGAGLPINDFNKAMAEMLAGNGLRAGTRSNVGAVTQWQTAQISITVTRE